MKCVNLLLYSDAPQLASLCFACSPTPYTTPYTLRSSKKNYDINNYWNVDFETPSYQSNSCCSSVARFGFAGKVRSCSSLNIDTTIQLTQF